MRVVEEFSRFAKSYQKYKIIQKRVASYLVCKVEQKPKRILDIGAGSGEVYNHINWDFDQFIAIDKSENMLNLHPNKNVKKIICSFNEDYCFNILKKERFDFIFSSSALQWSENLDFTLKHISSFNKPCAFSLFTDKTFNTIHKLAKIDSPIYSLEEILNLFNNYFLINYEIKKYRLFFEDKISMFRYIKRSGVNYNKRGLSYKETKELIKNYPYSYLEFEVVFIWTK
ncbi:MAG TPA: methyltransferase domain-containing protein [Campylobacterales bacterium]|nr:methyltransferase domain-containing protein [Campylobacterales bacterium]